MEKKRGLGKIKTDYTQNDLYKYYIKTSNFDLEMPREKFNKIIKRFNRELVKLLLYKNFEFKMPYTLGSLRIRKGKSAGIKHDENGNLIKRKLLIDYKRTKELWNRDPVAKDTKKVVLHLNEHSDGYVYGFYWNKTRGRIRNKEGYRFKTSRTNARWLSSVIKDESIKMDYFE